MRPVIKKQRIALFTPQGFLDGNSATGLITMQDMEVTKSSGVHMVLVSMKKVVFFNKNGVTILLDILTKLQKEMKATIGFCDYNRKQYEAFFNLFEGEIPFSLFKTLEIAMLFAGGRDSKGESEENVLIYNEDSTQRSMQAIEIYDRGYNPVVVQKWDDFNQKAQEREKFVEVIDITYLGFMGSKILIMSSCLENMYGAPPPKAVTSLVNIGTNFGITEISFTRVHIFAL